MKLILNFDGHLWASKFCPWVGEIDHKKIAGNIEYVVKSFSYSPYSPKGKTFLESRTVEFAISDSRKGIAKAVAEKGKDWISFCGTFEEFNVTLFHPMNLSSHNGEVKLKLEPLPSKYKNHREKIKRGKCPKIKF
jgi:hypothetical protein